MILTGSSSITRDKWFMRKRNRILVLPVVMLAAVIVFWILRGPAGPGRDILL
jgi:hypothetical protein